MIRKQNGGFDRIHDNACPGMSLDKYLPKEDTLVAKMRPSLTPSNESAAVADPRGSDRQKGGIKLKEKRLDARLWRYKGKHQRGSHFPICVFTNNVGRRSPKKLEERKEKTKADTMVRPETVPKLARTLASTWALAAATRGTARLASRCRSAARLAAATRGTARSRGRTRTIRICSVGNGAPT